MLPPGDGEYDDGIDRQTDGRRTVRLRFLLDAANGKTGDRRMVGDSSVRLEQTFVIPSVWNSKHLFQHRM